PVPCLGLRHHETGNRRLLCVAGRLRETCKTLGYEWLELINRDRVDALATAEQRAETLEGRSDLRLLVTALLRGLHLLVALFELVPEFLQLAHRTVLVELHVGAGTSRRAAERAGADHARTRNRSADHRHDDRRDER